MITIDLTPEELADLVDARVMRIHQRRLLGKINGGQLVAALSRAEVLAAVLEASERASDCADSREPAHEALAVA